MDHLTTTLHQLCELIALDNVDSPSDGAEVTQGVARAKLELSQGVIVPLEKARDDGDGRKDEVL